MYAERLSLLTRAYKSAQKSNKVYEEAQSNVAKFTQQLNYILGIQSGLRLINGIIVDRERQWQEQVQQLIETKIVEYLSYVYPADGYSVSLTTRILRGKVHVDGEVHSYFASQISGDVSETQGRLFQQVVSFAALVAVMEILDVKTAYMDEAFSCAAKANIGKLNALLQHVKEEGFNLVLIAQDTNIAQGIDANVLFLQRSLDNKTTVTQREVSE